MHPNPYVQVHYKKVVVDINTYTISISITIAISMGVIINPATMYPDMLRTRLYFPLQFTLLLI